MGGDRVSKFCFDPNCTAHHTVEQGVSDLKAENARLTRKLIAQKPVMDAAVKLTQHWVEWDGTENMVPWIQAVANAVTDAVEKSRGER
jgi:hypothetical protein